MKKTEMYKRGRPHLLNDLHAMLSTPGLSPSFKFHHLRNDFLRNWTSYDENAINIGRMNNPYWSKEALKTFNENRKNGAKNQNDLLKGLQHDHIVPVLFFEEIIMDLVWKNEKNEAFSIPKEALTFLFEHFAIGAMVTKHENQNAIDSDLKVYQTGKKKGEEYWKRKPSRTFGMPSDFLTLGHPYYMHPWARYMRSGIDIFSQNGEQYDFTKAVIDLSNLSENDKIGYEYWKVIFQQIKKNP